MYIGFKKKEVICKVEISASLLNINEDNNEINAFYRLEAAKIDYFHIDVMDGMFVQNNTVDLACPI